MRILQIFNKYAHVGGEEIAVGRISAELADHHELRDVIFDSTEWTARTGVMDRIQQFVSMAWNPSSIRRVRDEIEAFQPDLILLHNLMPVGSAGLYLYLQHQDRPLVHYIHNFRPFSVSGYCWGRRRLLPEGLEKNFIPEILAGAWQESRFKTAWYALLLLGLHALGVYQRIDAWIAISNFMRDTFIRAGIAPERIRVISHGWEARWTEGDLARMPAVEEPPMFLFLGRLTEEKGLGVLLDAWKLVEDSGETARLVIAGEGPMTDEVKRRCAGFANATWVGFQTGDAKRRLLEQCTAMVVPSIWWEPLGLVLYEAYDFGKPVLAARSGGIVDHVVHGETGWLHEAGNVGELARHFLEAATDKDACRRMGGNGRAKLSDHLGEAWIEKFDDLVSTVIAPGRRGFVRPEKQGERESRNTPVVPERFPEAAGSPDQQPAPVGPRLAIGISVYLADQNPGFDRSFGISRMTRMVLTALSNREGIRVETVMSKSSRFDQEGITSTRVLPWGTRQKWSRLLTDHLSPILLARDNRKRIRYFPKGYLPFLSDLVSPSVVTIHDTIIQYDEDNYPDWRGPFEYRYWSWMLKHTLRKADRILTVSQSSRRQILDFMRRHELPIKPITVTYEPCLYEGLSQPADEEKGAFALHLASVEPHKRTSHLVRWWYELSRAGVQLPALQLVGTVPDEALRMIEQAPNILWSPFLPDEELQEMYRRARVLVLPSEIEGFGLPTLEAYYLGTPVCFVRGTSVEEILSPATTKGGFDLGDPSTLVSALEEVLAMKAGEIYECGLALRREYSASKVADRMIAVFEELARERGL